MSSNQVNLIKKTKKFISIFQTKKFKPFNNSIFYLGNTSTYVGSYILDSLSEKKKNFFLNFYIILKDFLYGLNYNNYKVIKPLKRIRYNKIIITWAFEDNFKKDGSLNDRYFNINSKQVNKILWFIIFQGKKVPKKIDDNLVLLIPEVKKSFNFLKIINYNIKHFSFLFKDFRYFLALISNYNYFADIFAKSIKGFLVKELKFIITPFEGQPFQQKFFKKIKDQNKNLKIIGYAHAPPLPLPSNLIFKSGSPDQILVNGKDQKYCFNKILGWKKSQIKVFPSFRFIKSNRKSENIIFLPLNIRNINEVLSNFKLLIQKQKLDYKNFKIRNHPAAMFSKRNNYVIKKLKLSIQNSESLKQKIKKRKYQIFIGTSGAIIESLERGNKVIQICDDPLYDIYSSKIWPSIKTTKIDKNIYTYELKKKGNLIKFGTNNKVLKKYFNSLN